MQLAEKKYWKEGLNSDDSPLTFPPTAYCNMRDFRFGSTSNVYGATDVLESVGSTILLANASLPTGNNIRIGGAADRENLRILYFLWNDAGNHSIFCYDLQTSAVLIVLLNAQVAGGLNFDQYSLIHSAFVLNGCLYWTDDLNEPRRIDIDAAIAMNQPEANKNQVPIVYQQGVPPPFTDFAASYVLFDGPTLQYGPQIIGQLTRIGTGGPNAGATVIPLNLNWNIPGQTPAQVVANAISAYLSALDPSGTNWNVQQNFHTISIHIKLTWDWTTGGTDPTFPPTTSLTLQLYSLKTIPYTAPLDISIISWIRRQPGQVPTAIKGTDGAFVGNFIATEAFQFSYRYVFRNYETGTLSGLSQLQDYNLDSDTFNFINVMIPGSETIQQDVIQVDLVARYINSDAYFIIKSWQTRVPADAAAIAAHNAGTTALSYKFYNTILGTALDASYSVKPFDSVPITAKTVAPAKNRAFMGNYKIGYDTPVTTSLAYSLVTQQPNTTSYNTQYENITIYYQSKTNPSDTIHTSIYVIPIFSLPGFTGIYTTGDPKVSPPPSITTIPFGQLTFQGVDFNAVIATFQPVGYFPGNIEFERTLFPVTILLTAAPTGSQVFKSFATYFIGVTFYDYYGRRCGYLTNSGLQVFIPNRSSFSTFTTGINWALSNANALNEIPPWAYYYSVDITKCLRTRFFLQGTALNAKYVTKDTDGTYLFTETNYDPNFFGVGIDITAINSFGMGYVYSPGDQVILYEQNGNVFFLSVVGQSGNFIICQLKDVGVLDDAFKNPLFEIYTPYQPSTTEPIYEVGQINAVANPTLSTRAYSVPSGTIRGDVYLINRRASTLPNYVAEAMSPNDKQYKNWNTDAGRPNFIDTLGQVTKENSIAYSNTFIQGSKVNGLSTFDALDTKALDNEFGFIQRLILTSKLEKEGSIMLAICTIETASLYLGENIIQATTGEGIVAQTTDIIGYVNPLRGSYGTQNPESAVEFRGNVYWADVKNGKYIQYADNGLFPISNYKMTRYWKLYSAQYNSMTPQEIAEITGGVFGIFSGIDPHNEELLVAVPSVLLLSIITPNVAPKGYFMDYDPPILNPFDVWDGQGKTLVYKMMTNPNKWQGSYSITPEGYEYIEDNVYAWYKGNLYQLNDTNSFCNYFGVQYQPAVMPILNVEPTKPKIWNAINIQATAIPSLTLFRAFTPFEQGTDLLADDFVDTEGVFYATLFMDRLSPGFNTNFDALFGGNEMRSTALYTMLQFDASKGLVQVREMAAAYAISYGHVNA